MGRAVAHQLLAASLALLTACASSIPGAVVGSVLAKKTVGAILEDLDAHATKLIKEGEQSANLAIARAGTELHVATQNAALAFAAEREQTFESLSIERRNVLESLNRLTESGHQLSATALALEDTAAIDLERLIPFRSKPPFAIRRIEGYTLARGRSVYAVRLRGPGMGFSNDARRQQMLSVSVAGSPLDDAYIQKTTNYDTTLMIPAAVVNSYFKDSEIAALPVRLTATIVSSRDSRKYDADFQLLLLPVTAGNLTLSIVKQIAEFPPAASITVEYEPIYADSLGGRIQIGVIPRVRAFLNPNLRNRTVVQQVPNSSTRNPFRVSREERVADNEKISAVTLRCEGGNACRWCYDIGGKNHTVSEDGKTVQLFQKCDGDGVTLFWDIAYVPAEKHLEAVPDYLIIKPSYSDCFSFDLPSNTVDWKLAGRLFDGRSVEIIRGRPSNDFSLCQEERIGDSTRVSLRVEAPGT